MIESNTDFQPAKRARLNEDEKNAESVSLTPEPSSNEIEEVEQLKNPLKVFSPEEESKYCTTGLSFSPYHQNWLLCDVFVHAELSAVPDRQKNGILKFFKRLAPAQRTQAMVHPK